MTAISMRLGAAAFVLLCGTVVANMMLMQPTSRRSGGDNAALTKRPAVKPVTGTAASTEAAQAATTREADPARGDDKTAAAVRAPAAEKPAAAKAQPPLTRPAGAASQTGSADTVRAIQRELAARGYEAGATDGQLGLVTRAAIMAYEHDRGLALSAEPTSDLLKMILIDAGPANAAPPRRPGIEQSVQATQIIRTVQQSLVTLGYLPGRVDGRLSDDTVRAIRDFEIDQGMQESGRVSGTLLSRLSRLASQGRMASGR